MGDVLVPAEITEEVTQILSNLVLGDNAIRSSAEKAVNDRLDRAPELYLLAIAQFATSADTELLSAPAIATLERILLHSLLHEPAPVVRHKTVDSVTDLANYAMKRGRPWHALQTQAFAMADSNDVHARDAAFRVFAGCPNLVMDLQTDAILFILQNGLQDHQSTEVSRARVSFSLFLCVLPCTRSLPASRLLQCTSTRSHVPFLRCTLPGPVSIPHPHAPLAPSLPHLPVAMTRPTPQTPPLRPEPVSPGRAFALLRSDILEAPPPTTTTPIIHPPTRAAPSCSTAFASQRVSSPLELITRRRVRCRWSAARTSSVPALLALGVRRDRRIDTMRSECLWQPPHRRI
ncbi:hypothetical protein C8Q78DRAFT_1064871 [Trametes maxima]|nr:hypothetical protein C8Q78DRAFT_1064871 [Trametes maxima]